jgi:hypothetical protein
MTTSTRRELKQHQGRSATTIHGWPSVLFGLPFFGVGVGALVVWRVAPEQVEGPTPLLLWFGVVFGLVGFSLILHGLKGLRRRARVAERKRVVFMVPFNYVGFVLEGVPGRWFWVGIVGLFDVVAVVVVGYAFLGPGRSELLEPMTVTLRAVEEAYETRGSGKNRSQQVVFYETYVDSQAIDDVRRRWEGRRGLALEFDLPNEAAGTCLSERPPRYWELEITADVPGVDYKAVFLLPVY